MKANEYGRLLGDTRGLGETKQKQTKKLREIRGGEGMENTDLVWQERLKAAGSLQVFGILVNMTGASNLL